MRRPAPSTSRRALASVVSLALLGVAAAGIPTSGASFSSQTSNPTNRFSAAADWVAPTVSIANPGSPLRGQVTLTATAADTGGSGVASVALRSAQNSGDESAYVTVCTRTAAPYSCTWSTAGVPDGTYKVRATATDNAANQATSAVVSQLVVDNTAPTGTVTVPTGTIQPGAATPVSVAAADATSGVQKVVVQAALGAGAFADVCTATQGSSPYSCDWTPSAAGEHTVRAVVTDRAGNTFATTGVVRTVKDTIAPTGVSIVTKNAGTANTAAGTIDAGDTITLRYSEPMALGSILTGLNGTTGTALTVTVSNTGFLGLGNDVLGFSSSGSGAPNLGTIDLGSSTWLGVLASSTFAATATATTVNGATEVVVRLGTRSGSAPSRTSPVTLAWTPSASATDLAANGASTTTVTQGTPSVAF